MDGTRVMWHVCVIDFGLKLWRCSTCVIDFWLKPWQCGTEKVRLNDANFWEMSESKTGRLEFCLTLRHGFSFFEKCSEIHKAVAVQKSS